MATRSMIAKVEADSTVRGIYCHWDGYPAHNGAILHRFYNTEEQVTALLNGGDLSLLKPNIEDNEYPRTDGIGTPSQTFDSEEEALEYYIDSWCEWFYKFEDGIWWARDRNSDWRSLVGILEDVREEQES